MNDSYFFISLMNGLAWGGSEELWYRTALWLAQNGNKTGCAVYDWKEKEPRLKKLEDAGCLVFRLPRLDKSKYNPFTKLFHKIRYSSILQHAIEALPVNDYKYTIISQGDFEVSIPAWRNFYKKPGCFGLIFHNYNEEQRFSSQRKLALINWIDHARVNLFASGKIKEVLKAQLNKDIPNAEVICNPITFPAPVALTSYPGLMDGNYIFSMFAELAIDRKAQDKLIKTLSVTKWQQRNWVLHLYGRGKDHDLLQSLINSAALQQKVFLKGHVTDVAAALSESHLVLQITKRDAMPISVIEAMSMGRPLVVSRVGDMPVWINDGENGWVCEPELDSMDACLEKAWQAREIWAQMGAKSFEIFQKKFPASVEEELIKKLK